MLANSAYANAAKPQAIAVNKNKKITPGPPSALACPMVLNIPAPIMAAIPNAVRILYTKCFDKPFPSFSVASSLAFVRFAQPFFFEIMNQIS